MNENFAIFRERFSELPFAIREAILGNVVVENFNLDYAWKIAKILEKKFPLQLELVYG